MNRLLTVIALCIGCGSPGNQVDTGQLLSSWGEVVLADYAAFRDRSVELDTTIASFCATPDAAALQQAQDSWQSARGAWKQAEVFKFGPQEDEPLRLGPKIDFWPARIDTIEAVLVGTEDLSAEAVDLMGSAKKGLPVIEYLLFAPDDVPSAVAGNPRYCQYLQAISADLKLRAELLYQAWSPGGDDFVAELTSPGASQTSYFGTRTEALAEIVNRMAFVVEDIRADKLGAPLGEATGGEPQPDVVESPFSSASVENIRDNLRTVERLYFGGDGEEEIGLSWLINLKGLEYDDTFQQMLSASREAIDAIPEPLSDAVVNDAAAVQAAGEKLRELQTLIHVDIVSALSLPMAFNDADGD
jgi:predicted lipoprotein